MKGRLHRAPQAVPNTIERFRSEAMLENKSLQSVVEILRRIPVREIQESLTESPLISLAKDDTQRCAQWLERPVGLALQYGLEPIAHALGADLQEILSYIHPQCRNATACFQRLTLLRPDRVWGGDRIYICRTVRPLSMPWQGPAALQLVLVEGDLEVDGHSVHVSQGSLTIEIAPGTTAFIAHPSTFIVHRLWMTELVDCAVAAGIPAAVPSFALPLQNTSPPHDSPHSMLSEQFFLRDEETGYPKV